VVLEQKEYELCREQTKFKAADKKSGKDWCIIGLNAFFGASL
jgi:hypothetical protein